MKEKKKEASPFKKKQAHLRYEQFLLLAKRVALGVFIASFVWISVDGYHRLVSRQLVEESSHLIKPLSPQFRVGVLDEIKAKEYFAIEEVDRRFEALKVISQLEEEELSESEESSPSGENEEETNLEE